MSINQPEDSKEPTSPSQATSSQSNDQIQLEQQSIMEMFGTNLMSQLSILGSLVGVGTNHKMIFVVNMSLQMGRGKQCAQVAHAALGLYIQIKDSNNSNDKKKLSTWLSLGQKKIVVRANDTRQLLSIQEEANKSGLPNILISDAGCTQIPPGSKTVLGIFGCEEELNKVTGALRLL